MSLKIECDRCNAEVEHVCNRNLPKEVIDLFKFTIGDFPDGVKTKGNPYYSKGDEKAPFFSEVYLYSLFGKEHARSILAYVNSVIRAAGLDPHSLQTRAHQEMDADERKEEERQRQVAERKRLQEEAFKPVAERLVKGVKVLTYPSYPSFDHALRKIEKAGGKDPKVAVFDTVIQALDKEGNVTHEVTVDDALKFLRFEASRNFHDAEFVEHSFRIAKPLIPIFSKMLPEVERQRKQDLTPISDVVIRAHRTLRRDVRRIVLGSTQALDETLYQVWSKAGYDSKKTSEEIEALPERTYGKPYIDKDLAVIQLGAIEYAVPVTVALDQAKTYPSKHFKHFSQGLSQVMKLVLKPSDGSEPGL